MPDDDGDCAFAATLSLDNYDLPVGAPVFIEAYRQTTWRRFGIGYVGELQTPEDRSLAEFGSAEGIRFRVRVVDRATEGRNRLPARILAHADGIRPQLHETKHEQAESLLAVDWGEDDEFRHQPWRLEFSEDSEPLLRISRFLVPNRDSFVRSREFVSLVAPELLRSILNRALLVAQVEVRDGDCGWQSLWVRFAQQLPGIQLPPRADEPGSSEEWIDSAVTAFARRIDVRSRFAQWWSEDEAP